MAPVIHRSRRRCRPTGGRRRCGGCRGGAAYMAKWAVLGRHEKRDQEGLGNRIRCAR